MVVSRPEVGCGEQWCGTVVGVGAVVVLCSAVQCSAVQGRAGQGSCSAAGKKTGTDEWGMGWDWMGQRPTNGCAGGFAVCLLGCWLLAASLLVC